MTKDYLGGITSDKDGDLKHFGVKGMKWGVRKKETANLEAPDGPEASSDRYNRLLAKSKRDGANNLSDDELKFVTARGDAIRRVNILNERQPGFIEKAFKRQAEQQLNRSLQNLSNELSNKYMSENLRN